MKAAVRHRYGGPDVVTVVDTERPAVGDRDLLVKVHATTVNRTDCAYRSAKPAINRLFTGVVKPRRAVLGTEFAGVVAAVGEAVTSFKVGERVFGFSPHGGGHAEYLAVPEDGSLAMMPAGVTFEQVAPGTEGSHYALSSIRAAKVGGAHDVLVYGATGAIGSAAVQLLKVAGARVTAVCDTASVGLVEGLGADRVIDRTTTDFTADEQRFDVVIDAVGKSTFGRCRPLLKPGGLYMSSELGPWGQNIFLALISPLTRGKKVKFPMPGLNAETIQYFKKLIESGEFAPVVDRRYPLAEIVDAYRYVETGQKIGSVVISIDPSP